MARFLFTSESVTEGHPDKICDQISDAVLDDIYAHDPQARVACETTVTTGQILVMGEISSTHKPDVAKIARKVVCDIGYDDGAKGFDGNACAVLVALDEQSPDIAMGVDKSLELKDGEDDAYNLHGAGDQGMMFGYACDETPELMPMPISLAHKLALKLTEERENGKPESVTAVVVSSQHSADVELAQIREDIKKHVIDVIIPAELMTA